MGVKISNIKVSSLVIIAARRMKDLVSNRLGLILSNRQEDALTVQADCSPTLVVQERAEASNCFRLPIFSSWEGLNAMIGRQHVAS